MDISDDGYEGEVRLVDGAASSEGRVEIYHYYNWGTVCDDEWDLNDAMVVCRQLGYLSATEAPGQAHFGQGSEEAPIFMDGVQCLGSETLLSSCNFNGWGEEDCNHWEDAGVVCTNESGIVPGCNILISST